MVYYVMIYLVFMPFLISFLMKVSDKLGNMLDLPFKKGHQTGEKHK